MCDIVGTWQWINGDSVYIHDDGTMESERGIAGTWRSTDNNGYELEWSNGFTDTLTISSDCQSLNGNNQYGGGVSATRSSTSDVGTGEPDISTPAPSMPTPAPAGIATLTFESRSKASGSTVQIPLTLSGAQEPIGNMDITLSYDSSVLMAKKVTKGTVAANASFDSNIETGTIRIALFDNQGFSGDGSVIITEFEVIGDEGSTSPLDILDIMANRASDSAALDIGTQNGVFTVLGELKGDCDGDGKLTVNDALCALQMAVDNKAENLVMDMNGDGKVTSVDARRILRIALGLEV
jgi:hypothetical protein